MFSRILNFWGTSFGFWGEYIGNSLGDLLKDFGRNEYFEYERNFCFCQDFGLMEKERGKFKSIEVREASSSHLKMALITAI